MPARNIKFILSLLVIGFSVKSGFTSNNILHSKHVSVSKTNEHYFNNSVESKFCNDFESIVLGRDFLSVKTSYYYALGLSRNHKTVFICKKYKRYKKATRVNPIFIILQERFSGTFRYDSHYRENKKIVAAKQSSNKIKYCINYIFDRSDPVKNI